MAEVSTPNPAPKFHEGRGNRVLSITPAQIIMVRYADPDGKEQVALCYVFGEADYKGVKDPRQPDSRKPRRMAGVWVGANLSQLQNQLRLAPGPLALDIINRMEEQGIMRDGKLAGAVGGPVSVQVEQKDFSSAFEDLGGPAPSDDDKTTG